MKLFALAAALLLATHLPTAAIEHDGNVTQGVATVIDGDTLEIHGSRIRLHGIDAPESSQTCRERDGSAWRCGQAAALSLADKIGRTSVLCEHLDTDRYGRVIARCFSNREDLGDPPFHPMLQNLKGVYYRWWITLHKKSLLDPFDPISTKLLTVPVKLDELAESIAASEVRQNSKG